MSGPVESLKVSGNSGVNNKFISASVSLWPSLLPPRQALVKYNVHQDQDDLTSFGLYRKIKVKNDFKIRSISTFEANLVIEQTFFSVNIYIVFNFKHWLIMGADFL